MYQVQKQKGITLIALVITIIVLIILAGVAINLTVGENGLLIKAKQAKTGYNLAKEKEELEIEITNIQMEILSQENRVATLNDLYARIDKDKYTIELKFDEIATAAEVETTPTYSIVSRIGSQYQFIVVKELTIKDVRIIEPKVTYITFSDITWNEGKASITLSTKEEGTIEYKVGEDGEYQEGTTIENLSHGDMVYAHINNNGEYTEEETKVIYDVTKPESFEITTSELTDKSVKVSGNTVDNQTGIRNYSYVVENNKTIVQEIVDQTKTEYSITGLNAETEYVIYMLAYDYAGNVRKSNEVAVTTSKDTPPTLSNPQTSWSSTGTPRTGRDLDLGTNYDVGSTSVKYQLKWDDMEKIAKAISNTKIDEDTTNDITSEVYEFNITYDGTTYLIGVGDRMRVNGKVVRILGFNHDDLVNLDEEGNYKNAYGDGQTNTKAGISFEYVDFLTSGGMNDSNSNIGGWTKSVMYTTLNTIQYNNLPSDLKEIIKQVSKKSYVDNSTPTYSSDWLWLLSNTEIYGSSVNSSGMEGSQYKYYKNINPRNDTRNNYLKKQFSVAGTSSTGTSWWLRSFYYRSSSWFLDVNHNGACNGGHHASYGYGIAPGFSI